MILRGVASARGSCDIVCGSMIPPDIVGALQSEVWSTRGGRQVLGGKLREGGKAKRES